MGERNVLINQMHTHESNTKPLFCAINICLIHNLKRKKKNLYQFLSLLSTSVNTHIYPEPYIHYHL